MNKPVVFNHSPSAGGCLDSEPQEGEGARLAGRASLDLRDTRKKTLPVLMAVRTRLADGRPAIECSAERAILYGRGRRW